MNLPPGTVGVLLISRFLQLNPKTVRLIDLHVIICTGTHTETYKADTNKHTLADWWSCPPCFLLIEHFIKGAEWSRCLVAVNGKVRAVTCV